MQITRQTAYFTVTPQTPEQIYIKYTQRGFAIGFTLLKYLNKFVDSHSLNGIYWAGDWAACTYGALPAPKYKKGVCQGCLSCRASLFRFVGRSCRKTSSTEIDIL